MIQAVIDKFMEQKPAIREALRANPTRRYADLVKLVVTHIAEHGGFYDMDPERIHEIDDGEYQGALVYVIAADGYQPHEYWFTKVSYGSCSGCDTLQAIDLPYDWEDEESREPVSEESLDQLMRLALHIVEGVKSMQGEDD